MFIQQEADGWWKRLYLDKQILFRCAPPSLLPACSNCVSQLGSAFRRRGRVHTLAPSPSPASARAPSQASALVSAPAPPEYTHWLHPHLRRELALHPQHRHSCVCTSSIITRCSLRASSIKCQDRRHLQPPRIPLPVRNSVTPRMCVVRCVPSLRTHLPLTTVRGALHQSTRSFGQGAPPTMSHFPRSPLGSPWATLTHPLARGGAPTQRIQHDVSVLRAAV